MKKLVLLLSMVILLAGCQQAGTPNEHGTVYEFENTTEKAAPVVKSISTTVLRVVDGDTIQVEINGKKEKVRMLLIDTPETVHPNKPVEAWGLEASEYTKKTLTGKKVELEFDVQERDQYGRLLAYVWLDGRLYNQKLLEQGLAQVVVYPPNVKYVDQFRDIEKQAKKNKVGIWSEPSPLEKEPSQEPGESAGGGVKEGKWTEEDFANDKDCRDFSNSEEATAFMNASIRAGYGDHRLDGNHDGVACE